MDIRKVKKLIELLEESNIDEIEIKDGGESEVALRFARAIPDRSRVVALEVDGGVAVETIGRAAAAGADVIVAGTAVFHATDYSDAIAALRRAAD